MPYFVLFNPFILFLLIPPSPNTLLLSLPYYLTSLPPSLLLSLLLSRYDQQALGLDFLELLERFVPSDYELKLLQNYEKEGRPLDDLAEEDRFMMRFGKIPRLAQRISTLTFMGNFPESVKRLQPVSQLLRTDNEIVSVQQ